MNRTAEQIVTDQLLSGNLELPNYEGFVGLFGEDVANTTKAMFQGLWYNYLLNKGGINTTAWVPKFPDEAVFNQVLIILSDNGWVKSHSYPARNWAEAFLNEDKLLQFVTAQELSNIRGARKFYKYQMKDEASVHSDLVRVNGKIKKTGLIREGFARAANTQFGYDLDKLQANLDVIIKNTVKGMTKVREEFPNMTSDSASYDYVSAQIVQDLIDNPQYYSQCGNTSDSRGRAIKSSLSLVANPIGYKDFRSLLVIPEYARNVATEAGVEAIYLFIAELNGYREGPNMEHKVAYGKSCYEKRKLHVLDLSKEDDRSELHENIWLERLYDELDNFANYKTLVALCKEFGETLPTPYKWSTPIELDAASSMLQFEGCLLNEDRLLRRTNVIGTELTDPWHIEGGVRKASKSVYTPYFYGSMQSPADLLKDAGFKPTKDLLTPIITEMKQGAFGIAVDFKDFIIKHVKPEVNMRVKIWNDEFDIECNRWKNIGDETFVYNIYDSESDSIKCVTHTHTHKEPDLDAFCTYFVTLLVHNLDSQVADIVAGYIYDKYKFCLDIHDAYVVCPEAALDTRKKYAECLTDIRTNRKTILSEYFKSINIGPEASHAWDVLVSKLQIADEAEPVQLMALK